MNERLPGAIIGSEPAQYRALLEITESIAVHHDLAELFRDLVQRLPRIITGSSISMALHDPDRNTMQMHILEHVGPGPLAPGIEEPVEDVPGGWVLQHQEPLVCTNVDQETRFSKIMPMVRLAGIKSFCVVPLTTARRRLGALGIGSKAEHHYEGAELDFLQQVAKQVAVAVENALNFERARQAEEEAQRRFKRERLMLEINNAVVSQLDLGELLKSISACLHRVIPHDVAAFCIYDAATNQLRGHSLDFPSNQEFGGIGDLIPLEGTPEGMAFTSQKPVLIKKLSLVEFYAEIVKRGAAAGLKSGCAVPLLAHGRALGTLSVVSLSENAFSEQDAELLGNIGTQVAIAVENTLNFESAQAAKRQFMKERDRLRLLIDVANNLTSNLELRDLLQATVAGVRRVMQCDLVTVHLPNTERTQLQTYVMDFFDSRWTLPDNQWQPVEGTLEGKVRDTYGRCPA